MSQEDEFERLRQLLGDVVIGVMRIEMGLEQLQNAYREVAKQPPAPVLKLIRTPLEEVED